MCLEVTIFKPHFACFGLGCMRVLVLGDLDAKKKILHGQKYFIEGGWLEGGKGQKV